MSLYTRWVMFLRGFLPLIAVCGIAVVVAWPLYSEFQEKWQSRLSTTRLKAEEIALTMPAAGQPAQAQLIKPEFSGRDTKNRPFLITASRVVQDLSLKDPTSGVLHLEKPAAQMTIDAATQQSATLQALNGAYDPQAQTLQLDRDVVLHDGTGYVLRMQDLFVDMQAGSSKSLQPVSGEGPMGTLQAESLELQDKGAHIILHGRSKIVLTPQPAKAL